MKFKAKNEGKTARSSAFKVGQNDEHLLQPVFCINGSGILDIRFSARLARVSTCLILFIFLSAATSVGASVRPGHGIQTMAPGILTCALPAPGTFSGQKTGNSTAFLEWSTVSGAVAYRLMVYNEDTHTLVSNTVEYGTSKNLSSLVSGTTYHCVLASICSEGTTSDFIIVIDILD